jgi:hypothetical protein
MLDLAPPPTLPTIATLVPDELERIDLPGRYEGLWLDVWLNPPQDWLQDQTKQSTTEFLAGLVRAWNIGGDPPVPVTAEMLGRLPSRVLRYIAEQYWERYHAPLVPETSNNSVLTLTETPPLSLPGTPVLATPNGSG